MTNTAPTSTTGTIASRMNGGTGDYEHLPVIRNQDGTASVLSVIGDQIVWRMLDADEIERVTWRPWEDPAPRDILESCWAE